MIDLLRKNIVILLLLLSLLTSLCSCEAVNGLLNKHNENSTAENNGTSDNSNEDDEEPLVLDPGAHKSPFSGEMFNEHFNVEWTTIEKTPELTGGYFSDMIQKMRDNQIVGNTNHQYEYHAEYHDLEIDDNGETVYESVNKVITISFYADNEKNSRIYYSEHEGASGYYTERYMDEYIGKGYQTEIVDGAETARVTYVFNVDDNHPIGFEDDIQFCWRNSPEYGYCEKDGYMYFHFEFTAPGYWDSFTTHYDRYYVLDSDYNIVSYYDHNEVKYGVGSTRVTKRICIPYSGYFDMPHQVYD